jgi:hypothetical protein
MRQWGTMPRIPTTPTVAKFVETWTADFTAAVTRAAGANGRLTVAEARKLAQAAAPDSMFADNALASLTKSGKSSVTVAALTAEMKAYAQRAAEAVAGSDGKISLSEGAKLAPDLVEDFFVLRGKTPPASVTGGTLDQVKAQLSTIVADLTMPSETDARFAFVSGAQLNGAAITAALVRAQLTAQHDAVIGTVMPGSGPLSGKKTVEVRSAATFFKKLTTTMVDLNDPASVAQGKRFVQLKAAIDAQLTDVKVYRFGTTNISTFIVGRTRAGELAGLLTGQVET